MFRYFREKSYKITINQPKFYYQEKEAMLKKNYLFLSLAILMLFSSNITFGEEEPDIKLPGVTIIGQDKSLLEKEIKPEKIKIKIKEDISLTKEPIKEPSLEIEIPFLEEKVILREKTTSLKKEGIISFFAFNGGNANSLEYQYLYGQKIKKANTLFIIERGKSDGFIINEKRFNKHSQDKISLNLDLPLLLEVPFKTTNLKEEVFFFTEAKYNQKEEDLPFSQDKEIFKDLKLVLKNKPFKISNSNLNFIFTTTKSKLIHQKKIEANFTDLSLYLYTYLKKYLPKPYPLNLSLKIQREALEKDKRWNYLLSAESNNIEVKDYAIRVSADYYHYDGSSSLGFKIDTFYPYRKDLKLFATLDRKINLPTFRDIYGVEKYIETTIPCYSPQKTGEIEGGLNYQKSTDFLISSSLFLERTTDFISWGDQDHDQLYEPINIKKVKLSGLRLKVKKELSPSISLQGNLTYHFSLKNEIPGEYLPFLPKEEAKVCLKMPNFKGIDLEFTATYKGNLYSNHQQPIKLKSFSLLSFKLGKNIDDRLDVFISGDNILNKKYQIREGYFGNLATIFAGFTIKI